MVKNGFLAPVDLSANKDKFNPVAITAVTFNGNTYGVPWAVENIALFVNKSMVAGCPATFDDAVANAEKMIAAGKVKKGLGIAMQITHRWRLLPLVPAVHRRWRLRVRRERGRHAEPEGHSGIDSAGAVAAGKRLKQLVTEGIFSGSVTYDIAAKAFQDGQTPYLITGPWQTPDSKKALGDDLMVCPIPTWKDEPEQGPAVRRCADVLHDIQGAEPGAGLHLPDRRGADDRVHGRHVSVDQRPSAWTESVDASSRPTRTSRPSVSTAQQGIPIAEHPGDDAGLDRDGPGHVQDHHRRGPGRRVLKRRQRR